MSFNPDPSKQAQEVISTRKVKKFVHLSIFDEHIKAITSKVSKTIDLLRKLNNSLSRSSLTIIYKSFVRPDLYYGDVIFDKAYNNSSQQRLESLQYKVSLAITGAIKGTSTEKLYQELGL